jgi:superfamily II RNA helicase
LITCLRALDLLPAIVFLKSRSDCDQAVLSCGAFHTPNGTKTKLRREVKAFIKKYPHLKGHRQLDSLLNARVGAHHAGQLPYWKILIETMMNRGYLEAIFSTSTVAAGVNFPARTVALVQSDRFNGHEFSDLTATELHQMTGRAGRRGKDNIGFALVLPGLYQDPQLIHELRDSPPEPLMSQIHINFSMTLNLLLSHRPEEVKVLLERSFAAFQERHLGKAVLVTWERLVNRLKTVLPQGRCDTGDPYVVMENIQKYDQLTKKIRRLSKASGRRNRLNILRPYLKPGRLFLHKNGHDYVIFRSYPEGERLVCIASDVQKLSRDRKKRLKTKRVDSRQVAALYTRQVDIPDDIPSEDLITRLNKIPLDKLEILQLDPEKNSEDKAHADEARKELGQLSCTGCPEMKLCHRPKKGELGFLLKQFQTLSVQIEGMGGALWVSFKRHLRFLKETGFVDEKDELTADGLWASQLRLDHPLLIAEAIRRGSFEGMSPEVMAGCLAPFVWDRDQEMAIKIQGPVSLKPVESAFRAILESIEDVRRLKAERGFENPPIPSWPAGALYLWAKGVPWEQLVYFVPVAEGDMASLIVRTADHLRQVSNLGETHPDITAIAGEAISLIQREPVVID